LARARIAESYSSLTQLARDLSKRNSLGMHFVPNHCNQIHGHHPGRVTLALHWPSTRFSQVGQAVVAGRPKHAAIAARWVSF
jgi:hypothetical protein